MSERATRRNRPRQHATQARSQGGWMCTCGIDSTKTRRSADEHKAKAAQAAYARLDDMAVGAWLLTSDAERFPGGPAHLLANPGGWLYSGKLRRYGLPFYGHWGTLEIALDWGALLADVDAGKLETYVSNRQEQTAGMLRVAASLAGHGQVCLADVERLLTGDELERLREQLAKLWAT